MASAARLLIFALAVPVLLPAAWMEIKTGPIVVLCETSKDEARAAANTIDQFRWTVGEFLGRLEPQLHWPLTIVVAKPGSLQGPSWGFGRDGWIAYWPAGGKPAPEFFRRYAGQLIEDNLAGRMPDGYEEALATFVSTIEVNQSRLTLASPPPPAERTETWAFLHMMGTREETATRLRVLLSNLANGAELDIAWRNAYPERARPGAAEIKSYFAEGNFPSLSKLGRPVNLELKYQPIPALPSRIRVLSGDLMLAAGDSSAASKAYRAALNERATPAVQEGYGLALLGEKAAEEARRQFEAATAKEGAGPRAFIELARLVHDAEKSRPLLDAAARLNPKAIQIWELAAALEPGPTRRAFFLKKAVEVAPRRASLWQQLAMAQLALKQFPDSERSYRQALRAAANEEERARYESQREQFMQMRVDAEAAERKRARDEERAEIDRLKQEAEERIRAAEAKANAAAGQLKSGGKVEQWWDGPATTTLTGTLDYVSCQGARARISAKDEAGKTVQLLIPDAGKVMLLPMGEARLRCGPQRPPRRVKIEYVSKPGSGAAGEVTLIEFQ